MWVGLLILGVILFMGESSPSTPSPSPSKPPAPPSSSKSSSPAPKSSSETRPHYVIYGALDLFWGEMVDTVGIVTPGQAVRTKIAPIFVKTTKRRISRSNAAFNPYGGDVFGPNDESGYWVDK